MAPFRWIGAIAGSLVRPSPRGKVRWAAFGVLALFAVSGFLDYPSPWNAAADWANAKAEAAKLPAGLRIPRYWDVPYRLGLDLQGGTHLVYEADTKGIPESERDEAIEGVRDVIERRVNAFGVAEPIVQTNKAGGKWRIIAELAGVRDVREAIRMIGETPILEFKESNEVTAAALTAEQQKQLDAMNAEIRKRASEAQRVAAARGATLDFAAFAKEYSDDAATKDASGSLGFITQDGPYAELWKWANARAVGAVSTALIETSEGWNVAKLNAKKDDEKEVQASHLLVCWKGATGCNLDISKETALSKIKDLKAKATAQNFEQLAKENSTEPGASETAGDLGWFPQGAMVKPFNDAAFAMAKGTISDPVETEFGWHLIWKRDERPIVKYDVSRALFAKKTAEDILPPQDPWKNTGLSGKHVSRAQVDFDPNTAEPMVILNFNEEGKKLFAELTERNIGKPVAIFLDGEPISIPTVQTAITDGTAVISGSFAFKEAKLLAQRLNAGALPVPIELVSQQTVGATLGQDSLAKSLKAGLIGFLIVVAFMILYYRLPGLIAALALCVYTALTLAIFKLWGVTLTLSGIAGVILSIGMAVDANILIFERMKEELKAGRALDSAMAEGFKRAWSSIRDSNVASLITCFILYSFTSSSVRGFAVTLALGILVSMFSAISVTRTLLRLVAPWSAKHLWLFNK